MSSVDQIEHAIDQLSREEFLLLLERLRVREEHEWDAQMDRDAGAGKLDFLRDEARRERSAGEAREWPEPEGSI